MLLRKSIEDIKPLFEVRNQVGLNSNSVMAEVGCYRGESTLVWALSNAKVYAIDPWRKGFFPNLTRFQFINWSMIKHALKNETFENLININRNVEHDFDQRLWLHKNVQKVKKKSIEASFDFNKDTFDFVYIDALHDYRSVCYDIKSWLNLIKQGGWIGGHDYDSPLFPGVKKAVLKTIGKPDYVYADTSWLKQV